MVNVQRNGQIGGTLQAYEVALQHKKHLLRPDINFFPWQLASPPITLDIKEIETKSSIHYLEAKFLTLEQKLSRPFHICFHECFYNRRKLDAIDAAFHIGSDYGDRARQRRSIVRVWGPVSVM